MPNTPFIVGNWKMHGLSEAVAVAGTIARESRTASARLALCPPATLLSRLSVALKDEGHIELGGQDCHYQDQGAFTGDISAAMLRDAGAGLVLLGHSERRHGHKEPCSQVALKVKAALKAGLEPMICVGETLAERESGRTHEVLRRQLRDSLPEELEGKCFHVSYEPVWAIGTGLIATDDQIRDAFALIGKVLTRRFQGQVVPHLLYGGSVKPENAGHLLTLEGVGGLLVGGASLKAQDFLSIIRSAEQAVA